MSTEREPGQYWIKFEDNEWEVAHWDTHFWRVQGINGLFLDDELQEIDPTPVVRNNQKEPE